MFNSKHYVPILKWKRAEQGALKMLEENQKKHMTPLIQLVMPRQEPDERFEEVVCKFEEQMKKIHEKIVEVWGPTQIFVDFSLLYTTELKAKSLESILQGGHQLGAHFIPVVHLSDEDQIKESACSLAKSNNSGLCLRLICPDFVDQAKLNQKIHNFLTLHSLSAKEVDLLVDIKEIGENGTKYNHYLNLTQGIINLPKWRSFTFASGAFPENLSECKTDEENLILRLDWKNWKNQLKNKNIKRMPAFGDYTIQHPVYKEDYQFFHPTSSLKYTLKDVWIIMKGKRQKFEDYLAHAATLVKDARFYGPDFSYGDNFIKEKANHFEKYIRAKNNGKDIKGTGSTETWLRAGINHHLALAVNQVSSLS